MVVTSSYEEAVYKVRRESFDVALLDLLMPAESFTLGSAAIVEHLGREIGAEFPLIFVMVLCGIKKIAVVTDGNHHQHPVVATVDWLCNNEFTVNGSRVLIQYAQLTTEGAKDWAKTFTDLLD